MRAVGQDEDFFGRSNNKKARGNKAMRLEIFDERGERRGELNSCNRDMTAADLYAALKEIVPDLRFLLVDEKIMRPSSTQTLVDMFGRCRKARVHVVGGRRCSLEEESDSASKAAVGVEHTMPQCNDPEDTETYPNISQTPEAMSDIRSPDPVIRCRLLDDPGTLAANGILPLPNVVGPTMPPGNGPCDRLVGMGFNLPDVVEALSATGNDVEAAMAFLVDDGSS